MHSVPPLNDSTLTVSASPWRSPSSDVDYESNVPSRETRGLLAIGILRFIEPWGEEDSNLRRKTPDVRSPREGSRTPPW